MSRFTSVKEIELQVPALSASQAVEIRCIRVGNMKDQVLEYPPILKMRVGEAQRFDLKPPEPQGKPRKDVAF